MQFNQQDEPNSEAPASNAAITGGPLRYDEGRISPRQSRSSTRTPVAANQGGGNSSGQDDADTKSGGVGSTESAEDTKLGSGHSTHSTPRCLSAPLVGPTRSPQPASPSLSTSAAAASAAASSSSSTTTTTKPRAVPTFRLMRPEEHWAWYALAEELRKDRKPYSRQSKAEILHSFFKDNKDWRSMFYPESYQKVWALERARGVVSWTFDQIAAEPDEYAEILPKWGGGRLAKLIIQLIQIVERHDDIVMRLMQQRQARRLRRDEPDVLTEFRKVIIQIKAYREYWPSYWASQMDKHPLSNMVPAGVRSVAGASSPSSQRQVALPTRRASSSSSPFSSAKDSPTTSIVSSRSSGVGGAAATASSTLTTPLVAGDTSTAASTAATTNVETGEPAPTTTTPQDAIHASSSSSVMDSSTRSSRSSSSSGSSGTSSSRSSSSTSSSRRSSRSSSSGSRSSRSSKGSRSSSGRSSSSSDHSARRDRSAASVAEAATTTTSTPAVAAIMTSTTTTLPRDSGSGNDQSNSTSSSTHGSVSTQSAPAELAPLYNYSALSSSTSTIATSTSSGTRDRVTSTTSAPALLPPTHDTRGFRARATRLASSPAELAPLYNHATTSTSTAPNSRSSLDNYIRNLTDQNRRATEAKAAPLPRPRHDNNAAVAVRDSATSVGRHSSDDLSTIFHRAAAASLRTSLDEYIHTLNKKKDEASATTVPLTKKKGTTDESAGSSVFQSKRGKPSAGDSTGSPVFQSRRSIGSNISLRDFIRNTGSAGRNVSPSSSLFNNPSTGGSTHKRTHEDTTDTRGKENDNNKQHRTEEKVTAIVSLLEDIGENDWRKVDKSLQNLHTVFYKASMVDTVHKMTLLHDVGVLHGPLSIIRVLKKFDTESSKQGDVVAQLGHLRALLTLAAMRHILPKDLDSPIVRKVQDCIVDNNVVGKVLSTMEEHPESCPAQHHGFVFLASVLAHDEANKALLAGEPDKLHLLVTAIRSFGDASPWIHDHAYDIFDWLDLSVDTILGSEVASLAHDTITEFHARGVPVPRWTKLILRKITSDA